MRKKKKTKKPLTYYERMQAEFENPKNWEITRKGGTITVRNIPATNKLMRYWQLPKNAVDDTQAT